MVSPSDKYARVVRYMKTTYPGESFNWVYDELYPGEPYENPRILQLQFEKKKLNDDIKKLQTAKSAKFKKPKVPKKEKKV